MAEPTTANTGLIVPNTGDLVGAWGTAALNPDFQLIDGYFGGVVSLSLSAASTITLTTTTASFTPSAGPFQTNNAAISVSGTLTGNNTIKLSVPGVYRVLNNCVTGTNYVQLSPSSGGGNSVGVPNGEFRRFFFDGTSVWAMDMPHVGSMLELCVSTSPGWFNGFTVAPYLLCNGATYSTATYPALFALLGSTWGGNGVTTFGVPDLQNRYFIPLDLGSNNRITVAGAGINGAVYGATGGSQFLHAHTHTNTLTDPGHTHTASPFGSNTFAGGFNGGNAGSISSGQTIAISTNTTNITITNVSAGSGASQNIPPGVVAGLKFIKT